MTDCTRHREGSPPEHMQYVLNSVQEYKHTRNHDEIVHKATGGHGKVMVTTSLSKTKDISALRFAVATHNAFTVIFDVTQQQWGYESVDYWAVEFTTMLLTS